MNILVQSEIVEDEFQEKSPALIFNAKKIYERCRKIFKIVERVGAKVLLAVKAAPHASAVDLISPFIHGLDVSNVSEYQTIRTHSRGKILSFTGPICTQGLSKVDFSESSHSIINAESEGQLATVLELSWRGIIAGIRFRSGPSDTSEVAPPFGFDPTMLGGSSHQAELLKIRAAHSHGGGRKISRGAIEARAEHLAEVIRKLNLGVSFVNYGGGYTSLSLDEFDECLQNLRKLTPVNAQTVIEPGEYFFKDCGWAEATVVDVTPTSQGARAVTDLSSEAHLRWSLVEMQDVDVGSNECGCRVEFVGPTCHRGDFLGHRYVVSTPGRPYGVRVGDRIRVLGITSYSASWNIGVMGIAPARVIMSDM